VARLGNNNGDGTGELWQAAGFGSSGGAAGVGKRRRTQDGDGARAREVAVWRVWVTRWVPVTRAGGGSRGLLDPRRVVGRVTGVETLTGGGCGLLSPPGFLPVAIPTQ
jgi:hypothetical protein